MPSKRDEPFVGSVHSQRAVVAQVAHVYDSAPWVPTERDIAIEVVKELENRRVLYNDYELEMPDWVVRSVIEMREHFHEKLVRTREEGALSKHLRSMRAACRKFLDTAGNGSGRLIIQNSFQGGPASWTFFTALGELRSAVGVSLALLMAAYELSCEAELARILPATPEEGST
jgi:hypothetical protein